MQFLLVAYDGTDPESGQRRLRAREAHLAAAARLKAQGQLAIGGAILDDAGTMIGSALIFDFPDRETLDSYLASDPYVVQKVWQRIEVRPFRTASLGVPASRDAGG